MSNESTMRNGLPKKYWLFRNAVSIAQILIVVLAIAGGVIWAVSNGNGARLWQNYYAFSKGSSEWANSALRMPWESSTRNAVYSESAESSPAGYLGFCGAEGTPVFEGETENFLAAVCQYPDGSLVYVSQSESYGGIELPAEDRGGYWAADNGETTYGVSTESLSAIDNASGEYIISEAMRNSTVY